ncbi:MAG: thiamine biosynthesis protein ApbE [Methylophaga sp.]|nr:MAG: thiamine biosynthesis protein ApbE [Methylophaga sp.]
MTLFRTLLFFCCLSLTACNNDDRARQAKFYAFGTEIDVSLFGVDTTTADATIKILEQSFTQTNNMWHAWQPSTLTDINDAISQGQAITVSDDIETVINQAKSLANNSQHLFNPAAGKLFELWGFHADNWFESHPPPHQSDIDQWLANIATMDNIQINNGSLTSTNPMVKLGFGGFAKGYAVDTAIAALQQLNITNAIVNIGGDLRAIGSHGKRPWIIGIRHPRKDGMLASIALQGDESVFTSGDYERFFEFEGTRYPHILDPRTGFPARDAMSVTVLHTNAAEADAAATALFVAGNDWPQIAKNIGIEHVMLVTINGQIEMSPKMAKRVRLTDHNPVPIIRELDKIIQ